MKEIIICADHPDGRQYAEQHFCSDVIFASPRSIDSVRGYRGVVYATERAKAAPWFQSLLEVAIPCTLTVDSDRVA
jgi:hypothetical protein